MIKSIIMSGDGWMTLQKSLKESSTISPIITTDLRIYLESQLPSPIHPHNQYKIRISCFSQLKLIRQICNDQHLWYKESEKSLIIPIEGEIT